MPVTSSGLTQYEAEKLLKEFGPNLLPEKPPVSKIKIFISQLKSPLVYILLIAGLVTFIMGERSDSVIIALAVLINTILGYFQEGRAENALYALKKLIYPRALVVRDGKRMIIGVSEVVPGDVCLLKTGDKVPADGVISNASRLFLMESILTGESIAISKEKNDKIFMGTVVSSGNGVFTVTSTGKNTEIGKIAVSVQEPSQETPLRRQLSKFSRQLTWIVVSLTIFVFVIGILTGRDVFDIFETSVALAVSAIPEGLLVGLTVVLAIGMQRILKRRGLVRNLVSAETLGGVTTICLDKTGTLTEGRMQVVSVIGDKHEIAKQLLIANDLDDPIVVAAWDWANKQLSVKDLGGENIDDFVKEHVRLDSIPFSSEERFFATLNTNDGSKTKTIYVNGAPEFLLNWTSLPKKEKEKIEEDVKKLTMKGQRVVGLCQKKVVGGKTKISGSDIKKDLEWIGLISLSDPLRIGVSDALQRARDANIKLIVITGDYSQTAASVIRELGIDLDEKDIILGSELEKLSPESLTARLKNFKFKLFARTTPDQKLKIVDCLKRKGEVVAMMGDGVNDAPALKKADIGIVVGEASDVAKDTADLILIDSSFATVIAAVEEGRGIFDNIRKIVLYLLSGAFSEITAVICTILFGFPLPVTAAQILWVNLVTDGFPHLALTVDPREKNIMSEKPRNPSEPLVNSWMKMLILVVSILGGLVAFGLFIYYFSVTSDIHIARSIAFASLGLNSLVYVFSIRTLKKPFWTRNPFENRWLNLAFVGGVFLQVLPFVTTFGRKYLSLNYLSLPQWITIFVASIIMFMIIEILKKVFVFLKLEK